MQPPPARPHRSRRASGASTRSLADFGVEPPVPDTAWVFMEDLGSDRVRVWLAQGSDAVAALERRVDDVGTLRYDEIVRHFGGSPAFLGLAYHDYRGLRALLAR